MSIDTLHEYYERQLREEPSEQFTDEELDEILNPTEVYEDRLDDLDDLEDFEEEEL